MNALLSLLREDQLRHWDTVKWLVGWDIRGEGRSTLLALAFIAEADRHIGEWIPLWDHFDGHHQTLKNVGDRIEALLERLEHDDPEWRKKKFRIAVDGRSLKREA